MVKGTKIEKKDVKNIILIISALTIFSICIFSKTLFKGEVFAWYNDQIFQHNVFYKEWYRIIKETMNDHILAVYSWNTFLGTDYLASKLMYCVGDFLITPFFILYNGEINYDLLFAITTIITIVLSGINMYIYLIKYHIKKDYLLISIPIIYALGGFVMTYTGSYMFHRFYALLPLLFYFCEVYIQDGKVCGFALITAILFLQGFELLFSTCFFLVLYFIQEYKIRYQYKLLDILKKAIPLIISFFIGILMCGVFLIPLILFLKSNSRVAGLDFGNLFWNLRIVLYFFTSMVMAGFNCRSDQPPYLFYGTDHYAEHGLFATVLFILAFVVLFKQGDKNTKRSWLIGEIIIIICLLFRPFNSVIHGLSMPSLRWCFLLEFYHLMLTAYVFENYEVEKNYFHEINKVYFCYIALYLIFILVYKIDLNKYWPTIFINVGGFCLIYIYSLLLNKKYKILFCIFSILNVMIMYALSINSAYGIYGEGDISYNNEYLSYMIENDEDKMFRIYFDSDELWPYSWLNLNDSINNDYMSTTTYDSTYNSMLNDFLNLNGYYSGMIDINSTDLLRFLGTKYYITSSTISDEDNYEFYTTINNFNVYKLKDYNNIGYTVSSFISEKDASKIDEDVAIIKDEDYKLVEDIQKSDKQQLKVIEYNRQYLRGTIKVENKCLLFVSIPYSSGWTVKDQNGLELETIEVNGGFLGILIDENVNEVCFYYGTPGLKAGILISSISILAFIGLVIRDKKYCGRKEF